MINESDFSKSFKWVKKKIKGIKLVAFKMVYVDHKRTNKSEITVKTVDLRSLLQKSVKFFLQTFPLNFL